MTEPSKLPGWDARAILGVERERYGGRAEMFDAHGWTEPETNMRIARQQLVTERYGGIEDFVKQHGAP